MEMWRKPTMLIVSEQQIHSVISVAARSCRHILR